MEAIETRAALNDVRGEGAYPLDASIAFEPTAPLAEGWYYLRLSRMPTDVTFPRFFNMHRATDGSMGVRFRVGSDPRILEIHVCGPAEGSGPTTVGVMLSESIEFDFADLARFGLRQAGRDLRCNTLRTADNPMRSSELSFQCEDADFRSLINLQMPPVWRIGGPHTATALRNARYDARESERVEFSNHCVGYRVPVEISP